MNTQASAYRLLRPLAVALVAAVGAFVVHVPSAHAQDVTSGGQKPYIMILMDTSSSMEWTDEGDDEFPHFHVDGTDSYYDEWKSGKKLLPNATESDHYGPCMIWAPACDKYERPAWTPNSKWTKLYTDDPAMAARLAKMRADNDPITGFQAPRLHDSSQPRHVTLKEVLTGDMVMRHLGTASIDNLNPKTDGPGCWYVPRQRFSSSQNGAVCDGSDKFEKYPDYTDAHPHFQEIFDGQRANGLMDAVGGNAIFALAMFDGYKNSTKDPVHGWNADDAHDLNDAMDKDPSFDGLTEGQGDSSADPITEPQKYNYNLGVYQMISPMNLDMSASIAGELSNLVQLALVDAGYLSEGGKGINIEDVKNRNFLLDTVGIAASFTKDLKKYMKHHLTLGRQPIAKATPLAAAMYDIHEFFAKGAKGESKDHENPLIEDPYKECRPKHVVIMTDGYPEPEAGNGINVVGNIEDSGSAFNYNKDEYPYPSTEDAIHNFVYDQRYDNGNLRASGANTYLASTSWNSDAALRFNPRVDVFGMQVGQANDATNDNEQRAIWKLAEMAFEGHTCAGYYLDDLKPTHCQHPDPNTGKCCDPNDLDANGNHKVCLDKREGDYMENIRSDKYMYVAPDGTTQQCYYPAVVLTRNDPRTVAQVMQRLFNSILGSGVASRTRPTFVNRLDDTNSYATQGGQYRVFSGVKVNQDSPYWSGLLYRTTRLCSTNPNVANSVLALNEEVDNQVGTVSSNGDVGGDRRRIFTSFATPNSFDYDTREAKTLDTSGTRFMFGMDLERQTGGVDEFGGSYLGAVPIGLVDGRIPVERPTLNDAITDINNSVSSVTLDDYFQVQDDDELDQLINQVRARDILKRGRGLGAILNSSPVAVEPPQLDLPIDSYRAFKAKYQDRPSMLFFATTDGLLHAVYSGEINPTDALQNHIKKRTGHQAVQRRRHGPRDQRLDARPARGVGLSAPDAAQRPVRHRGQARLPDGRHPRGQGRAPVQPQPQLQPE